MVDGKEVFMVGKEQVIDRLVETEGEKYYIGEDGAKLKNDWHEIDNDGNFAYFGAMGQMIKNQCKEIDGKYYLFDIDGKLETNGLKKMGDDEYFASKDGHLLCNSIVNIDGQDKYFGEDAKATEKNGKVYNEDGELKIGYYYLDSYGNRLSKMWYEDCYLDEDGCVVTNQWIDGYYVGEDGKYLKNTTTPDGKKVGVDGKVVINNIPAKTYTESISAVNNNTQKQTTSSQDEAREELYIRKTETITDRYDYNWTSSNDNYDVDGMDIKIAMPVVGGINDDEVTLINEKIKNLVEQFIEKIKDEDVIANGYHACNSFNVNQARLKYTDNKVEITLSGKIGLTYDTSKNVNSNISLIIEYHRKDKIAKMYKESWTASELNLSSQDIVYAD